MSSSAKSVNYGNRESIDYSGSSEEDNQQDNQQKRRMADEMTDSGNDEEIEEMGSDSDGERGNSDADSRFDSNLAVDDNDAADKNYRLKRRLTETTTTRVTRQMSMGSGRNKSQRGRPRKDESRNVDKKVTARKKNIPVIHVFAFKGDPVRYCIRDQICDMVLQHKRKFITHKDCR